MLKKLTLCTILPFSLYSYELNFSKKFSQTINPDILTTRVIATIENKDEDFITNKLEYINDYIKEKEEIKYQDGNFNLTPLYSYNNNKRNFIAYKGNLSYNIITKDANNMNQFINELIEVKNKLNTNNLKLNISSVNWKVSDNLNSTALDSLRLNAINWISLYSKNLHKSCIIKKISIGTNHNYYPRIITNNISRTIPKITPTKSVQTISINPNFTLECR